MAQQLKELVADNLLIVGDAARLTDPITTAGIRHAAISGVNAGEVAGFMAENHESLMLSMAKSYLVFDRVDSMEEIRQKIDQISPEEILEIANDILDEKNLSMLTFV